MSESRTLAFAKMDGAGNDFVVLAATPPGAETTAKLVRSLCHRRSGIGADGALWMERLSSGASFHMHFFNRDGHRASLCLNGGRCVALRAVQLGWVEGRFVFRTDERELTAQVHEDERVTLWVDSPEILDPKLTLPEGSISRVGCALDTGDPHLVVPVAAESWTSMDFDSAARPLRHWDGGGLLPAGSNVHFVRMDQNPWKIRSFERGVEAETLACGSGCLSTAMAYSPENAVKLQTRSADLIELKPDGGQWSLMGPARLIRTGEFLWDGEDVALD